MKVLLLASYCGNENLNCSDDNPCIDCLRMCNVLEISEDATMHNLGGLDFQDTKQGGVLNGR